MFKEGDQFVVKTKEQFAAEFGTKENSNNFLLKSDGHIIYFNDANMGKFYGKVVTICQIMGRGRYTIKEEQTYKWTAEMFQLNITATLDIAEHIIREEIGL